MKRTFLIFILAIMAAWTTQAQQQIDALKQNIDFHIDSLGNAHIAVRMNLNASQWNNFKATIGNNVAILKRSMERALPSYFLDNFKYSEDAMNQSYTLQFDALGVSKIDQKGRWIAELDSKSPDVTRIADRLYLVHSTTSSGGELIEQNIKVSFSDGSSNIKVDKDAFGKAYFSFKQPTPSARSIFWVFSGGLFLVAGLAWGFLQVRKG